MGCLYDEMVVAPPDNGNVEVMPSGVVVELILVLCFTFSLINVNLVVLFYLLFSSFSFFVTSYLSLLSWFSR